MTRALTGRRPVSPAADDDFEINTYFLPDILKKYKPRLPVQAMISTSRKIGS